MPTETNQPTFTTETISKPKDHESPNKTIGAMARSLKDLSKGSTFGVIGETEQKSEPIVEKTYTPQEIAEKEKITALLLSVVEPPELSRKKPNREHDKISFQTKLKYMALEELRRFVPEGMDIYKVNPATLAEEVKVEIQKKYKDLSP